MCALCTKSSAVVGHKHQFDKLCWRFMNEEQGGRIPNTPVSVDAYVELTFDDEEAHEHEEEDYQQKVGPLQFAATTTRPDIAFACSKLGSKLTVRSDQHWHEVDRCLAYLADTRDIALEIGGGPVAVSGRLGRCRRCGRQAESDEHGRLRIRLRRGRHLLDQTAHEVRDALVDRVRVRRGHGSRQGGTPTVLRVDNKLAITVAEGLGLQGNLKHMELRYA
ncbi:unnamed protein product [Closterium sp. NIES-54]